jgi:transcriptional regulator with XRE-family HTH domain
MAGIKKEPGPAGMRLAEAVRRFRRGGNVTTAELSRRLAALGQPIPDTSITKTEQGTRRVDVDDLVALAAALGVTPNTLLLPEVGYLGASEVHHLTPAVSGSAEELWQWAQGERPLHMHVPGADAWLGGEDHPALRFTLRTRPYLTAPRAPGSGGSAGGGPLPELRELSVAIQKAMKAGASGTEIRRVAELTMTLPALMTDAEIDAWLEDGTRPDGDE